MLTSHARADGDAVGSRLACGEILRHMGKQAEIILRDGVPRVYQQLPFASSVIQAERVNGNYDAAILLECDSIQRTRLEGLEGHFLINIDHHKSGRAFADVNWIDPKAVATAELVYRLAREAGVKISPEIATCLYTAVLTDTGAFMFEGTNQHTFELARELVLAGADPASAHGRFISDNHREDASAGRGAFGVAARRSVGLDLGDARTNGARRSQRRRLRRPGELRAFDRRC